MEQGEEKIKKKNPRNERSKSLFRETIPISEIGSYLFPLVLTLRYCLDFRNLDLGYRPRDPSPISNEDYWQVNV